MRTKSENGNIVFTFAVLILSALLAMTTSALAAGSPSVGAPKSRSSDEKRQQANIHFRQGEAYAEKMRYKEAAREYEKAVQIDSGYAEAHSNLGYSYRKQGLYDEAVASYKRAIALDPELSEAYEYLGEAYAEMKKFDLAEEQLRALKRLDPDEAEALAAFIQKMKKSSYGSK
ncbi:MAG: tetratricopeptide repeat protein [Desulfatitalea sp.]|nr:tetratricopeptide repeat protein [Desulfatitalea sp.]